MKNIDCFDFIIIGAGIIGLSLAHELHKSYPMKKIAILEKEKELGMHASGRNSGVLHSGIYYNKDSFKAKVCASGALKMMNFAKEHDIKLFNGGKVIVPTSPEQYQTLDILMQNAIQNGVPAEFIDEKQLTELEPYAHPASKAIYCPTTSVIDNKAVLKKLKTLLEMGGIKFLFDTKVLNINSKSKKILSSRGAYDYGFLFNCAGAYADKLAKMEGLAQDYTLLPFKGIYYKLAEHVSQRVRSNIYPVPNISTPFLGVHFTRSIADDVYVGPTAIPVFGRENYSRLNGVKPSETFELFMQMGQLFWSNENDFRTLAVSEMLKYSKKVFFQGAKKLMPTLEINELQSCSKAGIRPQLMNKKSKRLEMDYIFEQTSSSMHVLNAISPAFTSSFSFAEMVLDKTRF
jgi:L-2-hydroxyglutarate oxidase